MFFTTSQTQHEDLLASFRQALSHPIRLRILESLREEGSLNVGELVKRLDIGQGHLSNHLACLKSCGLVQAQSQGRFVYYRISDERVITLLDLGSAVLQDHIAGVASCSVVRPKNRSEQNIPSS
ncbi:ArsR/SmtB family transcription factor [Sulfobacillus thermosulfidooxidans]|uniref:ArsR/SmtB family transcription factor n=1 Tax=Sulfobacillus thermosulfidooxidans TaxID=28034 RepID=UPI00096BA902|nr:metalloregulator ArsR/SmtB family transcription factor [Sulfobacillus thermosulfidooxidans]OLZ09015.1 transcriptional regulator [Sulfobacillus thermosulfidooxidans]OLZ14201.1 transcriptional regulator [Sulfobacillus thermosulfidooxidans]OLZ18944.1 transcriptional regulator [Sulfobacillus thermosulfidooxidans]